jgi:hypothetical protein
MYVFFFSIYSVLNVPKTILNYFIFQDKTLILNHILQVKNQHSFKIYLKNTNDTFYLECIKCFNDVGLIYNASRTYL